MKQKAASTAYYATPAEKLWLYINAEGEFRNLRGAKPSYFSRMISGLSSILPCSKDAALTKAHDSLLERADVPSPLTDEAGNILFLLSSAYLNERENKLWRFRSAVGWGLLLGANLMHFVMENPDSEISAKLDKLLGINYSKEAERGMERVIRKREKKKQDGRQSKVETKRRISAIVMMKNLVPQHGQVKAAEMVKIRMKKTLSDVKAGTVRRWYNTGLAKEAEVRKEAAEKRQGRIPP